MKKDDVLQGVYDRWQYIMLAVAIFLAIVFCCYYIITQSKWGFYTSGAAKLQTMTGDVKPAAEKRAYLTFDDGPSHNTMEILDILDANNVKATFFVVGKDESYYECYRQIVKRGHTLGLHSYSHDYDRIYAGLHEFAEDIEELQKLLYDVTGVECVYYRFPGGSSNTVARTDMGELISYVDSKGLIYFDWNALNNDAVCGSYTPEQLVDNIMKDAVQHDDVVILMHDLDSRHTTVESLQLLIDELRDKGYELLPIDESTPLVRHR